MIDGHDQLERTCVTEAFGVKVKVLPLRRVIASKKAANRLKDRAVLPALKAALVAIRRTKTKT